MYEEDRQTALAMYNQLFDDVDDEQGLLQLLVSPTRQAVVIARSYNAKERKLQVHAQSREDAGESEQGEAPQFVGVIDGIREEALSRQMPKTAEVSADQFSMFEDDFFAPAPENAAEDKSETAAAPVEAPAEAASEAPAAAAEPQSDAQPASAGAESVPAEVSPEAEQSAEPAPEAAADESAPAAEGDAVDAFLADFEIVDHDAEPTAEAEAEAEPADTGSGEPESAVIVDEEPDDEYDYEYDDEDIYTVRKPRVFLLILYILLAVPVGVLGIILLVVPTLLFLALAAVLVAGGIVAVTTAFAGLPLFADIIVAIGAAFILLALGLLALWTAIWFVGGAMVGLVRGLIHLGGKWCYKEVEV